MLVRGWVSVSGKAGEERRGDGRDEVGADVEEGEGGLGFEDSVEGLVELIEERCVS